VTREQRRRARNTATISPDTPTFRAAAVVRRRRRERLGLILETESALSVIYTGIERRLFTSIRAFVGQLPPAASQIQRVIQRAFGASVEERLQLITEGMARSIRAAFTTSQQAAMRAYPDQRVQRTRYDAYQVARQMTRSEWAVDGLSLSRRIQGNNLEAATGAAEEISRALQQGHSVTQLAQNLLERGNPSVYLPKYIEELRGLKGPIDAEMQARIEGHLASIERLRTPELRAAGRAFIEAVRTGNQAQIQRQLEYWVRDRALYRERVMARTEMSRAHNAAHVRSLAEEPWTKGVRWTLSTSHPRLDICDILAEQSLDDLGPGGYKIGNEPECPAHPSCLCGFRSIMDDHYTAREIARLEGTPEPPRNWEDTRRITAEDYARSLGETQQRTLLGPTRLDVLNGRHEMQVKDNKSLQAFGPRGTIRPIWAIEGRARPPAPQRGPGVLVRDFDPFREAASRSGT
jgi:hypothetical protein